MNKVIKTDKAPAPIGPYNQAIISGGLIFVSGQIALNPDTSELETDNLREEVSRVMKNIGAILEEAGSSFDKIIKSSIFLKSMDDFAEVNKLYGAYFNENFPARETVEVSRLPKDVSVEISIISSI